MKQEIKEVEINGVTYVQKSDQTFTPVSENEIKILGDHWIRKSEVSKPANPIEGMAYVLIRTYSAGVHIGYLKKRESTLAGIEITLVKARRIWYWDGAASLSQIATDGVNKPDNCKFSVEVDSIDLIAIEIISVSEKAQKNISLVPVWKK